MDRIEAMRVFVRVAELRSFTKAADTLGLPRATVTNLIQSLEAKIGARLLNRTTRQVHLTAEGTGFLERCRDLIDDIEDAESMFRGDAHIKGKIRVDMSVPVAQMLFIPLLHEFLKAHPDIEIELSSTDRRVEVIREGLDCVIRTGNSTEPGVVEKHVATVRLINCVSPAYVAKYGRPTTLAQLKDHKLIRYAQVLGGKPEGFEYEENGEYRELQMPSLITVNNTTSYAASCMAGLGIAQIPFTGVRRYLASGELVEVLPKFRAEPMKVKLVFPQRRLLAKRVRVFMDWIEPHIRQFHAE